MTALLIGFWFMVVLVALLVLASGFMYARTSRVIEENAELKKDINALREQVEMALGAAAADRRTQSAVPMTSSGLPRSHPLDTRRNRP